MLLILFFHLPIACHPPALLAWSKRVCFKIWVCRKYLFFFLFLCNSPCFSRVSGALRAESLCQVSVLGPLESHSGSRGSSDTRWQDEQITNMSDCCTVSFCSNIIARQKHIFRLRCMHVQRHKTSLQTLAMIKTYLCHLFTCYAGRSRLCVLWVSLWQRIVGRHFPEGGSKCWIHEWLFHIKCWSVELL